MNRLRLFGIGAVGLLFIATTLSAQTVQCDAPLGGFAPSPVCNSNCCLTVLPAPNPLDLGSGVCVEAAACGGIAIPDVELPEALCPLCLTFVTTADLDGPGSLPPITKVHRNIVANAPYSLDVDTVLPPLPGGLPVPLYDVAVRVDAISTEAATIHIDKLLTALPVLPLRIELVRGQPDRVTIGYDTLDSTAPQTFVAAIDLSVPGETHADVTIGGAANSLTLVNEEFTGNVAGPRMNRYARRATFSGDPERGTVVPNLIGITVQGSGDEVIVALNHDLRTRLDFALDEPGDRGTDTSGTIDELPDLVEVGILHYDYDGDGRKDQQIYYEADAIADARVHVDSPKTVEEADGSTTVVGREITEGTVTDLPKSVMLTLYHAADGFLATYWGSTRATSAEVTTDDGDQQLVASLENVPTAIEQLMYVNNSGADFAQKHLTYLASEIVDHAHVETVRGADEFEAAVDGLPTDVRLLYETVGNIDNLEYDADTIVPLLAVRTAGVLERDCGDGDGICDPRPHRRETNITATDLTRHLEFRLDSDQKTADYLATDRTGEVRITTVDEEPFFSRANSVDFLAQDLPFALTGKFLPTKFITDYIELNAYGQPIGKAEVLAVNGGGEVLPPDKDGVFLRDVADRYVLFARARGLHYTLFKKFVSGTISLTFDAAPPPGTDVRVDSVKDVKEVVWTNDPGGANIKLERDGTTTLNAVMQDYPRNVHLVTVEGPPQKTVDYTADGLGGPFVFFKETNYRGDPIEVTYKRQYTADRVGTSFPASDFDKLTTAFFEAMPLEFHVCQTKSGDSCAEVINLNGEPLDIFSDGLFEDFDPDTEANGGSVRLVAVPHSTFAYDDRSTVRMPISYLLVGDEVTKAGGCEQILLSGKCRYTDVKPGIATQTIDLDLGEFTILNHLESTGWVGHNIVNLLSPGDGSNQGYVAIDTGWSEAEVVLDDRCIGYFGQGLHPPPLNRQVNGIIQKDGSVCTASQQESCQSIQDAFPDAFGGKIDAVSLTLGAPFAAHTRVFEFDPDEVIFAVHNAGLMYCGEGTELKSGSSGFTGHMCMCSLPD